MHSAIYDGWVRHRRRVPSPHRLRYRLFMLYLDLDELPTLFDNVRFWSVDRSNLAAWHRADYLGDASLPLVDAVRKRVAQSGHPKPQGPIRMLTHLRYWGYCFNPVTFYYCYDPDDTLQVVVAEVTNTPWRERHQYILPADSDAVDHEFGKAFHVSPFMAMDRHYRWRFTHPDRGLWVHMEARKPGGDLELDASLCLRRHAISRAALRRALFRHPFMTAKVTTGIHWEALKLWFKRTPVFDHPRKSQTKP